MIIVLVCMGVLRPRVIYLRHSVHAADELRVAPLHVRNFGSHSYGLRVAHVPALFGSPVLSAFSSAFLREFLQQAMSLGEVAFS